MTRLTSKHLTPEQYVTEWITSFKSGESLQQMATRINRRPSDIRRRKRRYQDKGVNLPELVDIPLASNVPIDADKLNELMKELL